MERCEKAAVANRSPRLDAALSLQLGDSAALADSSISLLERIGHTGSISQAARECGISYRSAWQTIERLQNRSNEPLVRRSTGGAGGGGSILTDEGRRLVEMFRRAESEHRRFVELLGESLSGFEAYATFMRRWFMKTSVRNQLCGSVALISTGAVNTEVVLDIGGGDRITATITNDGAEELGISLGQELSALIRESAIVLFRGDAPPRISARNRFRGRVLRCCEGVVCSEVTIELPGSKILTAMITFESLATLELWPDTPVWVCFKASDVILAGQG